MRFTAIPRWLACTVPASCLFTGQAIADSTAQSLPFNQNWSNIGLITANDNWSGVPGIIGYRGDALTGATGTDPQTIVADGTAVVDVIANLGVNTALTDGGVGEFDGLTNPVVALQGSGTADAPFILLHLNSTGASNVTFSCRLRDIDATGDNAAQQIAVQYRVGNTGDFINLPSAYVADASTGPNLAVLKTIVIAILPVDANNNPLVQIRVITSNAVGSDEWIGVDDISVTSGLVDTDGDGIPNGTDNCPSNSNAGQLDCDDNGIGNACDAACPIDTDGDGFFDDDDNCPGTFNPGQEDCDDNGTGDACESQPDCNSNDIPDNCEEDCNGNFQPDDCDILLEISQDCNDDGIPDECQADCNGNGVVDACDINPLDPDGNKEVSADVNGNGIPDECELFGAALINEVNSDPPTTPAGDANNDGTTNISQDEFVEIVNISGAALDISGWTLSDATQVRHTFPGGSVLADDCGVVVFGGGAPTGQFGGMLVQTASTGSLSMNNGAEQVILQTAGGLYASIVDYSSQGDDDKAMVRRASSIDPTPTDLGVLPLVHHPALDLGSGDRFFSPGRMIDGDNFPGCSTLPDADNDGIPDATDNCDNTPNPDQADCDDDGIGNVCDTDPDANKNGVPDTCEVTPHASLRLNELRRDQPSTDCDEYIEIKGNPGVSLDNLSVIVIGDGTAAQGSGVIERVISLHGHTIPADGHFLIAGPSFTLSGGVDLTSGVADCTNGSLGLENGGDNLTVVLVGNFTGSLTQDLDTDTPVDGTGGDGTLDVTPWLTVADAVAVIRTVNPQTAAGDDWYYAEALSGNVVGPDGNFVPSHVYRCEPGRTWQIGLHDPFDIGGGTDTAGAENDLNPCAAQCFGDITDQSGSGPPDGFVDINDYTAIVLQWGNPGGPADVTDQTGSGPPDGVVDINDYTAVILNWGVCNPIPF